MNELALQINGITSPLRGGGRCLHRLAVGTQ